jgi:predicted dehydrogenase
MKKIRTGVIGMGVMGIVHTQVYLGMPEYVEMVGFVESDQKIAAAMEKRFRIPCYQNFDAMIQAGVDAVSICTPDDQHMEYVLKAMSKGVKVLVEKPLEVSSALCKKIIDSMPDETYIMVGHTMRFDPRLIAVKKALDAGSIGKTIAVKINRSNTKAVGQRISKRTSVTWFLGIHDIDILHWLLGKKVIKVKGKGVKVFSEYYDYTTAQLEFEDGTIGIMENHWLLPNTRPLGLDASITIIGEKGMLEADLNTHPVFRTCDEGGVTYFDSYLKPEDENNIPRGDMYRELQYFIECVRDNKVPSISAAKAMEAVSVIERIEQSMNE